jgi:hypothetical protein
MEIYNQSGGAKYAHPTLFSSKVGPQFIPAFTDELQVHSDLILQSIA